MQLSGTLAEKGIRAFDAQRHIRAGSGIPRIWAVAAEDCQAQIFRKTLRGMELVMHARSDSGIFIQKLAGWLDTIEREQIFDRLVLVAAPQVLEKLRNALSRNVCVRLAAEANRELAKMSTEEIRRCMDDIVWF